MGAKDSIGLPGYLLSTGSAGTLAQPSYGVADSNGYVGADSAYRSHANAFDRPGPSSVKADAPEEEVDLVVRSGGAQLADGDGNEVTDDNDNFTDNQRAVESNVLEVGDDEAVDHLGRKFKLEDRVVEVEDLTDSEELSSSDDSDKPKVSRASARTGGKPLAQQKADSED